ncbi:type II secretion system minor pseudopilin GspK [Solimonas sp. K1W22B-7]|uniref:type II secretion system minor pseudopilin GspK n=1 Tax=Solimonas sp. K1W22B-7 TaxID=2303331 RepID=UPI0013C4FD3E|nr:type II secretion system minor pseudopilin GspK [Solimonas sp. K1W22B-7]
MKRQNGVALITAILVVALATVAATAIITAANIAVHRSANLQDSERAWWYADGIEAWLLTILERDSNDNQYDGLGDIWAKPVDYLPIDEGGARGQVSDLQGRFNLNNLALPAGQAYDRQLEVFLRLLQGIEGIESFQATAIASAIRDWVDADSEPTGFEGGEDSEYLGFNPPYRVPNRPMESVTELLAVKGVTREIYAKLRPYVTALPQIGTAINVNTAPDAVLFALAKQPGPAQARFLESRLKKPAENKSDLTSGADAVFGAGDAHPDMYDIKSSFFMLRAEIFVGSGRLALYSFYYRPPGQGGSAPYVYGRSIDSE